MQKRRVGLMIGALLFSAFSQVQGAGDAPEPTICTRSCWGSRSTAWHPFGTTGTFNRVTIHHTANQYDFNVTDINGSKARVRGTQNYHMDALGWSDIGYHFLVDKFGNKFEGLNGSLYGGSPRGAHDAINNSSLGICMLGWFDAGYNGDVPYAQRQAVYDIAAWRVPDPFTGFGSSSYGGYSNIGYVLGHYQVSSKTCPGTYMQPRIGTNFYGNEARLEINERIVGSDWQASYVSNTFVSEVRTDEVVTISVTYENTGTQTWNNSWTRLATSNPRGSASPFYYSSDWISSDRATAVDQSSVSPGNNGTFTFQAKAPSTAGSYQQHFELVHDGVSWFEGTGDNVIWYVDVVDPPDYEAEYVANTFPAQVTAGETVEVSVTYKNTGDQTWNSNTRLGTENERDRNSVFYNSSDWLGANRPTAVDSSTAPGANGTFTFIAKAPSTTGNYEEHFALLQEGVTWFPSSGPGDVVWYVEVLPAPTPSPTPTPTVTPSPTPPTEIILDNASASFSGTWYTGSSAAGKYGSDYRYAYSGSGAEATYSFSVPQSGTWRVSVWYPQGSNRANNAPHRIDHYSGYNNYNVNQQTNGGQWVTLGDHYFGSAGYVVVRTTGANPTVVMADAVKMTYQGP